MPISTTMDGRREPRFQIYAPAKLTLVDHPERDLECLLLDISATGMKFVTDQDVAIDEVIVLEVEDHLVLADVRYSQPRGEKFAIGAERIHAVNKAALSAGQTKPEQIRFVIADYRSRIKASIIADPPAAAPQETAQLDQRLFEYVDQHRDRLVEAAVKQLVEQWSQDSDGPRTDGTLRAAIVERVAERVAERTPSIPSAPPPMSPPPAPVPQQIFLPQPPKPEAPRTEPQSRHKSWRMPLAAAAAIAMMSFTGSLFWSYRHSAGALAPTARPANITASPAKPTSVVPATNPATRHAEIRVMEPAWVSATSDGKELFGKLLAKDETRQIEFAEKALVRVGNAGGVEISIDGKPIGPLGPRGKIRELEITPAGYRFVPVTNAAAENN